MAFISLASPMSSPVTPPASWVVGTTSTSCRRCAIQGDDVLLGHQRRTGHEPERLVEILEDKGSRLPRGRCSVHPNSSSCSAALRASADNRSAIIASGFT